MKNLLAAIASFIFIKSVSAQSTVSTVLEEVPAHVSTAFSGKFPEGDVKKWEKRREGYVAHFKKDGLGVLVYLRGLGIIEGENAG